MQKIINHWRQPDGRIWATISRIDDGYLIDFDRLAQFSISLDGETIELVSDADCEPSTLEHLLQNQVLPLALSRQLKLVLHGSAVAIENRAAAFLGATGSGKSSLAASFAVSGFPFLTDDGLQLEPADHHFLVRPSQPSIRLWQDSERVLIPPGSTRAPAVEYTTKSRVLASGEIPHCTRPLPLLVLYILGDGHAKDVEIAKTSVRDTIVELVKNSFLLDVEEHTLLKTHFDQLTKLATSIPCFRLDYPRNFEKLPHVRKQIIAHCRDLLAGNS